MADMRNRTPFYGAVPTSKLNADHVFMADGSTLQEQADKKFELIEEITLTEDVALIERTTEPDTTPYNFSDIIIAIAAEATTANNFIRLFVNDTQIMNINGAMGTAVRYSRSYVYNMHNLFEFGNCSGTSSTTIAALDSAAQIVPYSPINKIALQPQSLDIPAGSVIKIYAVRA